MGYCMESQKINSTTKVIQIKLRCNDDYNVVIFGHLLSF